MKHVVTILLLFVFYSISAQESIWRLNNSTADAMGNHDLTAQNSPGYSTSEPLEGTHAGNLDLNTGNRWYTSNTIDFGSGGLTISGGFRNYNNSGTAYLFDNRTNGTGTGIYATLDLANKNITVTTSNGTTTGSAVTANSQWTAGNWVYWTIRFMDTDGGYCKIWVNGSQSGTDSTIQSGWDVSNPLYLGANSVSSGITTFWGTIDNYSVYLCPLSNASISTLYTNRTSSSATATCPATVTRIRLDQNTVLNYNFSPSVNIVATPEPDPAPESTAFAINEELGKGVDAYGVVDDGSCVLQWDPDYFQLIADSGFNHIRLVFYGFNDNGTAPNYTINSSVLTNVKSIVDYCIAAGLIPIIDYHQPAWLNNPIQANIDKYLAHWGQLATYFQNYSIHDLVFELVNEPTGGLTRAQWNTLLDQAIDAIRVTNPTRLIAVSPGYWAGVPGLADLVLPSDTMLLLSLHYYEPQTMTFQGIEWTEHGEEWYPTGWYPIQPMIDMVTDWFAPAVEFSETHNIPVHIGEFGTYRDGPLESRARYLNYHARYFESLGWSWCHWDFNIDFNIYNSTTETFITELRKALIEDPMPDVMGHDSTLIYQSNFTSTTGWSVSGSASLSTSGGELVVTISNGGSDPANVILTRATPFEKGKIYRISYTIRSASTRSWMYEYTTYQDWNNLYNEVGSAGYSRVNTFWFSYYDAPSGAVQFRIGGSNATFYVSNFRFEEITPILEVTPDPGPDENFTIYNDWDFESLTLGSQITEAYFGTVHGGYNYGQTSVVNETINGQSTKALRITQPAWNGTNYLPQTGSYAFEIMPAIGPYTEVYVTYNWKYGADWQATTVGKLTGAGGLPIPTSGVTPVPDNVGWKYRATFGNGGATHIYYYDHSSPTYGTHSAYSEDGGSGLNTLYMNPGNWYSVTERYVMNTCATCYDGVFECWIDGVKVMSLGGRRYWSTTNVGNTIRYVLISHFHGGDTEDCWPTVPTYGYLDNVKVWVPVNPNTSGNNQHSNSYVLPTPAEITSKALVYDNLVTTTGTLRNSEYGSSYSVYKDETWLIDAGEGHTVTYSGTYGLGAYDYIFILDGNQTNSTLSRKYYGGYSGASGTISSITSSGRYMFIRFVSDKLSGGTNTGFTGTVTIN